MITIEVHFCIIERKIVINFYLINSFVVCVTHFSCKRVKEKKIIIIFLNAKNFDFLKKKEKKCMIPLSCTDRNMQSTKFPLCTNKF